MQEEHKELRSRGRGHKGNQMSVREGLRRRRGKRSRVGK